MAEVEKEKRTSEQVNNDNQWVLTPAGISGPPWTTPAGISGPPTHSFSSKLLKIHL